MKSQGAKLSFSSVSVRKENACALSPISPFFWLLAGLAALRAANRWQIRETPEKPKEQSSAFRALLCVGDAPGLSPCPGKQELSAGTHPERTACVRGSNADTNTVRVLPTAGARACETRGGKRHGARLARRSRAAGRLSGPSGRKPPAGRETPEKPKEQSSAFWAFLCVRDTPELFPAQENRSRAWACTRNQPRACETRGRKRHGARLARRSRATCSL